jgi:transcriptional regulator with XRE-family HTH domain
MQSSGAPHERTKAQRFGDLITEAATRAGYDLSPRGGGRVRLAAATGMDPSNIGRMLSGKTLPSARFWEPIADAVGLDLQQLLDESGIFSDRSLSETDSSRVRSGPITLPEAADALGITDPAYREMFYGTVERIQRAQEAEREGGGGQASAK